MRRWLLAPIFVLSCIAGYDYYVNPTGWYSLALMALTVMMGLIYLFQRRITSAPPEETLRQTWQPFLYWHNVSIITGIICFLCIIQVQGHQPLQLAIFYGMSHKLQFVLFLIGISCITWGMAGGFDPQSASKALRRWLSTSEARWLILFTLMGFLIRVIGLDEAVRNYVDEAHFAQAISYLRNTPDVKIMTKINGIANFTWIYPYFQYIFTEIFGTTLADLRAISVLVGTATIPAIYLLGRWVFNRRVGLIASFLLAIYLPHVHFSRLGMNNIADPLFGVLTIALLWRGLQTNNRQLLALAGVSFGLTSYFYEGGRLVFLALIIGWCFVYLFVAKQTVLKRGFILFFVTFMLIASCFYLSVEISDFGNAIPRLAKERISNEYIVRIITSTDPSPLSVYMMERINPAFLFMVSQPDASRFYYSPHNSLVFMHMLPFMLIGIGVAMYHWRCGGLLLIFWFVLTILGNSLIVMNNWTPRFVVVFPALILFIALGFDLVYQGLQGILQRSAKLEWLFGVMIRIATVGLFVVNFVFYFGIMLPVYKTSVWYGFDYHDAMRRAQQLDPNTVVYVIGADDDLWDYIYIIQEYERHAIRPYFISMSEFDIDTVNFEASRPLAFFVIPDDYDNLIAIHRKYRYRYEAPEWSPYNIPKDTQFALYYINGS